MANTMSRKDALNLATAVGLVLAGLGGGAWIIVVAPGFLWLLALPALAVCAWAVWVGAATLRAHWIWWRHYR